MKLTVSTEEARKSFYPTPPELAAMLLDGLDLYKIHTVLEPSAGKGNLLDALGSAILTLPHSYGIEVDCDIIELDPALRGMVKERFCQESGIRCIKGRIAHEDFLVYQTLKPYDLILMNPPFADGDLHLLKAISMQEQHGGKIRCILNAETLRNPCTKTRQLLMEKLGQWSADISYVPDAFADAERQAHVEVAIIKLDIPAPKRESEFFSRMKEAEKVHFNDSTPEELMSSDPVQAIVSQYRVECNAGVALIHEYQALAPYIMKDLHETQYSKPLLELSVNGHGLSNRCINDYLQSVRFKYWSALCKSPKFTSQLTTSLQEELFNQVDKLKHYEFDVFNIQTVLTEFQAKMVEGIKDTILDLFDTLTSKYTYSPEYQVNKHYYNGWCSNKAHKVANKVIQPCYGVFSSYSWEKGKFNRYEAYKLLRDIEKTLNYLDGNLTAEIDLGWVLERAEKTENTRNIHCKYFDVTFFKKGTCHIKFTCPELVDRFNIFCSMNRGWLPPSYGRKRYADLDTEEKAVVDSFHGDDTEGSGEAAYTKVTQNAGYYLAAPNQQVLCLPEMGGAACA